MLVKQLKVHLILQRLGYAKQSKFYGYCNGETHESHLSVTGVHFFRVANSNKNLTWFKPSEIHYQPDPTPRKGSLDM